MVENLDELVVETPKKRPSKDDIVAEIVKKLLPYLNIDEETARLAVQHGLVPPKTTTTTVKKTTITTHKKKKSR